MSAESHVRVALRRVPLKEVAKVVMGQSPPSSAYNANGDGLPFFQGKAEFGALHPTPVKWCTAPTKTAEAEDVLMSVRAPVGPTNIATERCCIGRGLAAIRPNEGVRSKWLLYTFRSMEKAIDDLGTGTTFKAISGETLRRVEIPIADLEHQDRVLGEIEKQFSRLDEAVANLKRVKANLKRYQAAVLNDAVAGRLVSTEAPLKPGQKATSELAESLPQRISKDRQEARIKGKGAPVAMGDLSQLPALPRGWAWATLDQIGQEGRSVIYGIIKPGPNVPDGIPYVRVTEMKDGFVAVEKLRRASREREAKFARARLRAGDVLISKDGTIGRVAVVPPELEGGNITQHVMRAPIHPFMDRDFVVCAIRSDFCQRWLTRETRGVALLGVNVEDFRRLPIPIPPIVEQRRIVAEVDRRLSIVREVEAEVDTNLKRAHALRQAVLAKAFGANSAEQPLPAEWRPPLKLIPGTTTLADSVRAAISAEVVHRLHQEPTFGHVKHQKVVYLIEHIARIESMQTRYRREKFGPVNLQVLEANERILEQQAWYAHRLREESGGHHYVPMTKAGGHTEYLTVLPPDQLARVRDLIALMRDWDTDRCERFATVYAAWNDLILLHKPVTPDAVLSEILDLWDEGKQRFTRIQWLDTMQLIETNGFSPTGFGHPTRPEIAGVTGSLFDGHSG